MVDIFWRARESDILDAHLLPNVDASCLAAFRLTRAAAIAIKKKFPAVRGVQKGSFDMSNIVKESKAIKIIY